MSGVPKGVLAIDGTTVRRSHDRAKEKSAIHLVSAFSPRQRLVLGQVSMAEH
jgi:hypothetical protein